MLALAFTLSTVVDWLGTFAVHSTLALGAAWLVSVALRKRALALQELLLRTSMWLAIVSASVQCAVRGSWMPEFVLSPLLVSVVIRTYGWIILLGNNGLINQLRKLADLAPLQLMYNEFGVVLALVHVFLPFMILPIMGAVQGIDPRLEEAARSLGAGRAKVFLRVLLPLSMPGIQSGCVLVFILSCGAYVTPALLGAGRVHTITTEVITLLDQFLWPFGAALALLLSLVGLIAVGLYAWLSGRLMRGIA